MNIAFIGCGVMGAPMAVNLRKNGYRVFAYNRSKEKAQALKKNGIEVLDNLDDSLQNMDVVITMVGYPSEVSSLYLTKEKILDKVKKGTYVIDMTTSSPQLAKQLHEEGKKRGVFVLDAPVSGGEMGAIKGTLSVMVGGDIDVFYRLVSLFNCFGKNIVYIGEAGSGQYCKLCNQIAIAGALAGVSEALHYARNHSLDPKVVYEAISKGAAGSWQMENNYMKMVEEDFKPMFYSKHFLKDLQLAVEEDELPVAKLVKNQFLELSEEEFFNQEATPNLIRWYQKNKGV